VNLERIVALQALQHEKLYSRPAPVCHADGSGVSLLDALSLLCPQAFGPQVSCKLRVESCSSGAFVAVCFICQLEVASVACTPSEAACNLSGASQSGAPAGSGADTTSSDRAAVSRGAGEAGPRPVLLRTGAACAHGAKLSEVDDERPQAGVGAALADSQSGTLEQLPAAGEATEQAAQQAPASVDTGPVRWSGGGELRAASGSQATSGDCGAPPPQHSDDTIRQSSSGECAPSQSGRQTLQAQTLSKAGPSWFSPAKIVRGCLHEGVQVQVAGVRAHAAGGSDILHAGILPLYQMLHAPDMFLYVVVHLPPELCASVHNDAK
jgi:hypothetical protein